MLAHCWPSLVVLVLLAVSGAGWLACFRANGFSGPQRLGLAFACGTAWLGLLTALLAPWPLFRPAVLIPLLLLPLLGFLRRAEEDAESLAASDRRVREWLGFLPVLPLVALSFWLALQRPVWSIDAQRRWVLHAQWTADEHTPVPERMQRRDWSDAHPSYPPLVSSVLALALQLGADRDEGMRVVFPTYFLALLGVVYGYARRRAPPLVATALALVLATTPCLAVLDAQKGSYGLGADSALADIPLALFLTALAALVLEAIAVGGAEARARWRLAALVGVGAVLTKNEGLVYAPALVALTGVLALLVRRASPLGHARRPLAGLLAALVAGAALWKWVARDMAVREGERYLSAEVLGSLAEGLGRAQDVTLRAWAELIDTGLWGLLWIWPVLWLPWYAARFRELDGEERIRRLLPFLWLLAGLTMVLGAYLATGWKNGSWLRLMDVSLARLLIHHAPLALILACDLFDLDPRRAERDRAEFVSREERRRAA